MPQPRKSRGGTRTFYRWSGVILAVLGLLALGIQPVLALSLQFTVPKSSADIYIHQDGTASVDYTYVFANSSGGDPIDAVDIGTPTTSYDLGSASGTINGQPVSSIEKSPYVNPGIALNLNGAAIQPGQTGTVTAHIGTVRRLLFKANTKESEPYASFHFQPNYFSSDFVSGQTDMTVTLHLPPGLKENEPRYIPPGNWPGDSKPESNLDDQGNVYYRWHATNASSSAQYDFGAAFPARLVPASALLTETPNINLGGLCPWLFCLGFGGFLVFTVIASINGERKRKLAYLPPKISVEGNGIKRGLTAVEAAIIMQQPMDKILTMILFSTLKKNAAQVVSQNPMKLQVTQPLPEGLQPYERDFLAAMAQPRVADQRRGLQDMMTNLVKGVSEKMRGFSRKDTVAYYTDIMNKAWQQVEQANTPELKMQSFDEAMDWTMLDRRFNDRTRETFGPGPVFLPGWWWRFDPTMGGGMGAGAARPSVSGPSVSTGGNRPPTGMSMPNLPGADFAASMVGGMQNFASSVVGDIAAFTGGVTSKTNPPPPPSTTTRSGGGLGGGGGAGHCACACACACAGCACACAGGGR